MRDAASGAKRDFLVPSTSRTGVLVRNDLRSADAAWPEYCGHREAGLWVNEGNDVLLANSTAASALATAFVR